MEENLTFPKPEEDDDESSDDEENKTKKKTLSLAEIILLEETNEDRPKEKVGLDIALSLLIDKESFDQAEPETLIPESEHSPEADVNGNPEVPLSPEEVSSINQAIAEEHLKNPVTEESPLPPVTEFLGLVVSGVEPETAIEATKIAHQLDDGNIEQPSPVRKSHPVRLQESASPTDISQTRAKANLASDLFRSMPKKEVKSDKKNHSKIATRLAADIFNRHHPNSAKKVHINKVAVQERQIEREVSGLEAKLTGQEVALQHLSKQKETINKTPVFEIPYEQTLPNRSENLPGIIKPEHAGHIGKVLVGKERPVTELREVRAISNPEQIKSLRRNELLDLSNDVRVGGASLKHMFENSLFDENALRRLLEAHYKGKDILPQLRREILDRQNYFERDPRLRNQSPSSRIASDELLKQVLDSTNEQHRSDRPLAAPLSTHSLVINTATKTSDSSLANVILGIVISLLIGLILFLVFR